MIERILLFEPQCREFEHVPFNAALIATAMAAWPDARLRFVAEAGHGRRVRELLEREEPLLGKRLECETLEPPRDVQGWARLPAEKAMVARLADEARSFAPDLVIVCSLTGPFLLRLKLALWRGLVPSPILAVPHAILNSLGMGWTPTLLEKIASFPAALHLPAPPRLRFLALGEGVMRELGRRSPSAAKRFFVFEHPYFMRPAGEVDDNPAVVRFCYLGGGYKLFSEFVSIARELRDDSGKTEFALAGFVSNPDDAAKAQGFVSGVGAEPLGSEEMSARIEACTYVIGMCKPVINRLTASASLLDALAHGKPGIYIRTPFIESWFERLGDIGYLCADAKEMRETIAGIQREFPRERYRAQCENIMKGRDAIEPRNAAAHFKDIIEQWGSNR